MPPVRPVRSDVIGGAVVRCGESEGVDAGVGTGDDSPTEEVEVVGGDVSVAICLLMNAMYAVSRMSREVSFTQK